MRRWTLITICLMLVFGCSCAPREIAALEATASALTASPTSTPAATPEPTVTATPMIAPTASPKPTVKKIDSTPMIVKGREKVKADINQRFKDFLNGTGEFTEKRIKSEAFIAVFSDNTDLGCVDAFDDWSRYYIQGIILYYQKTDQGEIFAFGTKNKEKKRVITILEHPSDSILRNGETITVQIFDDRSFNSKQFLRNFGRNKLFYDFLDSYICNFTCISFITRLSTESSQVSNGSESWKKIYQEALDPKVEANYALMTNINIVDNRYHDFFKNYPTVKEFYDSKPKPIISIDNFDDFESMIENNYSQIPCFDSFEFIRIY